MGGKAGQIEISRPELQHIRYKGGCIELRKPEPHCPYPGPNLFQFDVARDLELIEQQQLGAELIQDLSTCGKLIKITYQQLNFARCGPAGLYELCFQFFNNYGDCQGDQTTGAGDVEKAAKSGTPWTSFGNELRTALTQANLTQPNKLAKKLLDTSLYSWTKGTKRTNPYLSLGANRTDQVHALEERIPKYLAGTLLPSFAQFDVMSLLLEPHLRPGEGNACLISYDPKNSVGRPAQVGLFHELVHAYYTVHGTQLGKEDSTSEFRGGRHFEQMSTGFHPHNHNTTPLDARIPAGDSGI